MRIPGWPWNITCLALLLLPTFVALGLWQIERGKAKDAMHQSIAEVPALPVIDTHWLTSQDQQYHRRNLALDHGVIWENRQILLDNQLYQGKPGVYVWQLASYNSRFFLVNRGWVIWQDRTALPNTGTLVQTPTIQGVLRNWPTTGVALGKEQWQPGTTQLVNQLHRRDIEQWLGVSLADFVVYLDGEDDNALNTDFPPPGGISALRHYGYAFQWFALACAAAVLTALVWVRHHQHRHSRI